MPKPPEPLPQAEVDHDDIVLGIRYEDIDERYRSIFLPNDIILFEPPGRPVLDDDTDDDTDDELEAKSECHLCIMTTWHDILLIVALVKSSMDRAPLLATMMYLAGLSFKILFDHDHSRGSLSHILALTLLGPDRLERLNDYWDCFLDFWDCDIYRSSPKTVKRKLQFKNTPITDRFNPPSYLVVMRLMRYPDLYSSPWLKWLDTIYQFWGDWQRYKAAYLIWLDLDDYPAHEFRAEFRVSVLEKETAALGRGHSLLVVGF